jgi:hypothetical protein
LIHDPIGLTESTVILLCLVFCAWRFSPRQRRMRLRVQARNRMETRHALTEPTERTGVPIPAPSVSDSADSS